MKEYTQVINGIEYTFLLDDEDAARRGLTESKRAEVSNKAQTPTNKNG